MKYKLVLCRGFLGKITNVMVHTVDLLVLAFTCVSSKGP